MEKQLSINTPEQLTQFSINPNKRYYYGLDQLRAGLMLIGIFWHAGGIVTTRFNWIYSSIHHKMNSIYMLVFPTHLFRMETFYMISGFLSYMIITRKGKKEFIKARIKRVLIPLVLGCFIVNFVLQIYGSLFLDYKWQNYDLWRMVMHGWFLITLFICALIDLFLPKVFYKNTKLGIIFMAVVVWFGYCSLIYYNGDYWHFFEPLKANLFQFFIVNTIDFYPFYYFGAVLFIHQDKLDQLSKRHIYYLFLLALFFATLEYFHHFFISFAGLEKYMLRAIVEKLSTTLAAFFCAIFLFSLFFKIKQQGGKVLRYIVNSAIVIYLVHHPLLVIIGYLIDSPKLSTPEYYSLLILLVTIASYILYELIRRHKVSRFLFGLK